jgi:flagellar protein FliO/FliZ
MADFIFYLFLFALLAALAIGAAWIVRGYLNGVSPVAAIFGPRPEKRLAVVEQASVDGRRRLILVRRDDVEHLIMTGGPVDVVIETGINTPREPVAAAEHERAAPVFTREPRSLGQSGGERAAE